MSPLKSIGLLIIVALINLLIVSSAMACIGLRGKCKVDGSEGLCCPRSFCYRNIGWIYGECRPRRR